MLRNTTLPLLALRKRCERRSGARPRAFPPSAVLCVDLWAESESRAPLRERRTRPCAACARAGQGLPRRAGSGTYVSASSSRSARIRIVRSGLVEDFVSPCAGPKECRSFGSRASTSCPPASVINERSGRLPVRPVERGNASRAAVSGNENPVATRPLPPGDCPAAVQLAPGCECRSAGWARPAGDACP